MYVFKNYNGKSKVFCLGLQYVDRVKLYLVSWGPWLPYRWLLEAGGYLVAEDADSVCQRKKYSLFNYCTFIQRKTYRL